MKLTPDLRAWIDRKTYDELLICWRFSPKAVTLFQGESRRYFLKRMAELRQKLGDSLRGAHEA